MVIAFKQKCSKCGKNYVLTKRKQRYILCYECQKDDLKGEIKDSSMKKLFDIPEEYYMKNSFLRDIKIKYIKYGSLSDKQIEAFKKTILSMKEDSNN